MGRRTFHGSPHEGRMRHSDSVLVNKAAGTLTVPTTASSRYTLESRRWCRALHLSHFAKRAVLGSIVSTARVSGL